MKVIEKKIWPDFFKKVKARQKNTELRLADFRIAKGDVLLLREWDPQKRMYTGRSLRRKARIVNEVDMLKFHTPAKLKRFGLYLIELS